MLRSTRFPSLKQVYCTPHTIFRTPFMPLAFGAEGCSSLTFPTVMGPALANQLLFLDKTFPASDFVQCGFVTGILPKEGFFESVMKVVKELAGMPPVAVEGTRELVIRHRYGGRERLMEVNKVELENLEKMWVGKGPSLRSRLRDRAGRRRTSPPQTVNRTLGDPQFSKRANTRLRSGRRIRSTSNRGTGTSQT